MSNQLKDGYDSQIWNNTFRFAKNTINRDFHILCIIVDHCKLYLTIKKEARFYGTFPIVLS